MTKKWIQKAVKKPGRVKAYMLRKYGKSALDKNGNLDLKKLEEAYRREKDEDLKKALELAIRLKKMHKRK